MPDATTLTNLFASVDDVFIGFFTSGAGAVAQAIRPTFNLLVTLYVLLWGLATWRGLIEEPMSDGIARILKVVLIGTFALNTGVYAQQIATTLYTIPDALAQVVLNTTSNSGPLTATGTALDKVQYKGANIALRYLDAISVSAGIFGSLTLFIQALLVFLFTIVLVAYATALVLLSKIALAVVLAVGPIFIAFLLFEPTRNLFSGWLAQATNCVFTYIIAVAFVSLGLTFFNAGLEASLQSLSDGSKPSLLDLSPTLLLGLAVFVALMQANAIASALGGGVQITTMGAVGWAMRQGAGVLKAPLALYQGLRAVRHRRLANAYYRKSMGMSPSMTTRSVDWAKQRIRGSNSVTKD